MPRLFFALWPDAATRAALARAAAAFSLAEGRRVPAGNLHLTMAFLGNVDDAAAAAALAAGSTAAASRAASAFELSINRSGYGQRRGMLWLAPDPVPAALPALREALQAALAARQLPVERRPYHPHVTLARKLTRPPPDAPHFAVRWLVRELALVESATLPEGARYTPLSFWPLGGEAAPEGSAGHAVSG